MTQFHTQIKIRKKRTSDHIRLYLENFTSAVAVGVFRYSLNDVPDHIGPYWLFPLEQAPPTQASPTVP